jgi:atlastin
MIAVGRHDISFDLDEDALAAVLLQGNSKDKNVVVFSVAGVFHKGKSFYSTFLWYMVTQGNPDLMGSKSEPL